MARLFLAPKVNKLIVIIEQLSHIRLFAAVECVDLPK